MMDAIQKKLLEEVADLHDVPQGAYSLRINGSLYGKNDSENITAVVNSAACNDGNVAICADMKVVIY